MNAAMMALLSEVAVFLRWQPSDVKRAVELDGLPVVTLAGRRRNCQRIWLPALWKWLVERGGEGGIGTFEEFRAAFAEVIGRKGGEA